MLEPSAPTWINSIALLILSVLWGACVIGVYLDTGPGRRDLKQWQRTFWTVIAVLPIIGVTVYLVLQHGLNMPSSTAYTQSIPNMMPKPHKTQVAQIPSMSQRQPGTTVANAQRGGKKPVTIPAEAEISQSVSVSANMPSQKPEARPAAVPANGRVTLPTIAQSSRITQAPTIGLDLEVISGPGVFHDGSELCFGSNVVGAECKIGAQSNFIPLEGDNSISAAHIRINVDPERVTLQNLTQHSHTWVDGTRLSTNQTLLVQPGSNIRLGNTTVQLRTQDAQIFRSNTTLATFDVIEGPHLGEKFPVEQFPALIGRGNTASIQLDKDTKVSREHAELYLKHGNLWLRDQSRHGTMVNGYSIVEKALVNGDKIRVGNSLLIVRSV